MVYMYIVIGLIAIALLSILCMLPKKKHKKKSDKSYSAIIRDFLDNPIQSKKDIVYLKYKDQYLTWKFAGSDLNDINSYNLVLLPYKNKQNEFKIHTKDYVYLKPFYEKYNLPDTQLNEITFVTSSYNKNKGEYLELIETGGKYIIKASLWSKKGANAYLHLDSGKLFFDSGIHNNIVEFTIE